MKGSDGFIEIAGITAAVVLLNQWLRRTGILSGNGQGYGSKPKPKPTYNPTVVTTLKQAKQSIWGSQTGPLQKLQRSVEALEAQEKGLAQAQARVSAAVLEKEKLLADQRARVAQAQSGLERKIQQESLRDMEAAADRMIEMEKTDFEKSAFKAQLDSRYREALASAREAYQERFNLYISRGRDSEPVIEKVQAALIQAADEEYATSEGSVERAR